MSKKLLVHLAASVALIQFAVSGVEANEQQENTKNTISLVDLQKLITTEISQAKNRGVGTKPYEDAMAAIDTDFERGEALDKIRQRYDAILKNLEIQNKESSLFRSGRQRLVHSTQELQLGKEEQWGEFAPLMRSIQSKIKFNWQSATPKKSKNIVVLFELLKDGLIRNLKVTKSSGDPEADEIALQAVRRSTPFQRPPANLDSNQEGTWIEFTFDQTFGNGGTR